MRAPLIFSWNTFSAPAARSELGDLGIKGLTIGRDARVAIDGHEISLFSHL
jgi:hypothetical protein